LLSAGQRQRIGLARALYRNPKILILDEATSNLDPSTEKDFLQLLDNLDKKLTLIVIAHRISAIRNCNRIVLIDRGEVVDDGPYQDITLKSHKFAALMSKNHKEFEL
jgi:ABC-type bacteriocin/lantibiotic exporter with double-glycine peptidase domain